jgi:hypothetical protein
MIYTKYWFPMEIDFEQQDYANYFNRFMRDFLTIEIGIIPNIGDVYSEFKLYGTKHLMTSLKKSDIIQNYL